MADRERLLATAMRCAGARGRRTDAPTGVIRVTARFPGRTSGGLKHRSCTSPRWDAVTQTTGSVAVVPQAAWV
jgi:hypothetical protein